MEAQSIKMAFFLQLFAFELYKLFYKYKQIKIKNCTQKNWHRFKKIRNIN